MRHAPTRTSGPGPTRTAPSDRSGGSAPLPSSKLLNTAAATSFLVLTLAPGVTGSGLAAQQAPGDPAESPAAGAAAIDASEIEAHVDFLASDELRGRDTPSRGLEVAARYVATRFASIGLVPPDPDSAGGFIHRFAYEETHVDRASIEYRVEGREHSGGGSGWRHGRDFLYVPSGASADAGGRVLFAGPVEAAAEELPEAAEGRVVMVTLPPQGGGLSLTVARKAANAGATGLLVVLAPELGAEEVARAAESAAVPEDYGIPIFGLRHDRATEIVRAAGEDPELLDRSGKGDDVREPRMLPDVTLEMTASGRVQSHRPPNVVGILPGSDPAHRDEYVVVSAHLDHVGVGEPDATGDSIYNGADDNAAGVAALLEVAEAFASLPRAPKRSVLFLAPSGEEKGLLGSRAFVRNGPVSVDSAAAVLNMDLLGRNHPDTVVLAGRSYSTLGRHVREAMRARSGHGLEGIRAPPPSARAFFRSDHLPFAAAGVPGLLFTTGGHDDYHRPSDEPAKIDAEKTSRVARLLFRVGRSVADADRPPRWTEAGRAVLRSLRDRSEPIGG